MEIQTWIARKRETLRTLGPLATRNLTPSIRDFAHAVTTQRGELAVVAELARATPEEGQIRRDIQTAELASAFDAAGVSALAVATDSVLCEGSTADLQRVSSAVTVPVVARDLFLRSDQIYQARLFGADAVLLTAAAVRPDELRALMEIAASLHMAAPVEVRTESELSIALSVGARLVIIPAFAQDSLSHEGPDLLLPKVPRSITPIVRGPFGSLEELESLRGRADAVWIAKPILEAEDPEGFLSRLVEAAEHG